MPLSIAQKRDIWQDGFTVIPGAVSRVQVDAALRAINHSLGEGIPAEDIARSRAQSFCPGLGSTDVITDLFNRTPLPALANSVLGEDVTPPARSGQIALRFPQPDVPLSYRHEAHIDGVYSPTNGLTKGTISNFTALVAVFLSDMPYDSMGNFIVWPGSHRRNEAYFRTNGTDILLSGMPPIEWGEAHEIRACAGDAVICHYALGHTFSPNLSPHIRYAVYFRITHRDHHTHPLETLTDIWLDWHGLHEFRTQELETNGMPRTHRHSEGWVPV